MPQRIHTQHQQVVPRAVPTRRRGGLGKFALFLIALALVGGVVFGYKILAAGNKISAAEQSIIGQLKDLLFRSNEHLSGEEEGRVNVLLLAIGGEGHKGQDLADTIMVASIRPQDGRVSLLSIPRDLYVQVPGEDFYSKLNAVHAYGESKEKDGGPELLQEKVEEITGLPIHYYARVDFDGFKQVIDAVGGVHIVIEKTFFDYWHKISFPAGTEKMNGERALAYVRARYIEGSEGGDFKRAARQQQVLLALRDKVFSVQTAFDFRTMNTILDSLSDNIRTSMQLWEMKRFFEMARTVDQQHVKSVVLSTGSNGVLVGGTEILGGTPASIIKTRTGDYSETQAIAQQIFSDTVEETAHLEAAPELVEATPTPSPSGEPTQATYTVEVRNGTNVTGLAKKTSDTLTAEGYEVLAIGNAKNRATEKTTTYATSDDAAQGAKEVASLLKAQSDSGIPEGEAETDANILVILGADAQ